MTRVILDASAVLALLLGEPGADAVLSHGPGALLSAVNYAEVVARTASLCGSLDEAKRRIDRQELEIVPLDRDQAVIAASLAAAGRPLGLALADRCCLALAMTRGLPVLTADRVWRRLDVGISIEIIR
ncbi:MAG TPA: type II toxin-antitoxin system VapC family toxin [Urbifossiella sp.]|jgi:PIN domain nuclease of toxin-antitoxin system|nr:type II toxin-antitoxin system VapC family toxin [Urbifossiella sp.]